MLKTIEIKAATMPEADVKAKALTTIAEHFTGDQLKGIAAAIKLQLVREEILKQLKAFI